MNRRHFLTQCAEGLAFSTAAVSALKFPPLSSPASANPSQSVPIHPKPGKAKHVIQIWMWGGPSQLETFDPKPGAGPAYCGTWNQPLKTNVPAIEISQSLPNLAQCADLFVPIRTMTHETNHHEIASYRMQTGRMPGGMVYPNLGAVISMLRGYDAGYDSPIPPYVVLTSGQGRFSESGFLGSKFKPFITGGDPSKTPFLVSGYVLPGVDAERQTRRQGHLAQMDYWGNGFPENDLLDDLSSARQNAWNLISGTAAETFDLGKETDAMRDAYGRTWFGQSRSISKAGTRTNAISKPYPDANRNGILGWLCFSKICGTEISWRTRSSGGAVNSEELQKSRRIRHGLEVADILDDVSASCSPAEDSKEERSSVNPPKPRKMSSHDRSRPRIYSVPFIGRWESTQRPKCQTKKVSTSQSWILPPRPAGSRRLWDNLPGIFSPFSGYSLPCR